MSRIARICWITAALLGAIGCGRNAESLGPPETFRWVSQPITFSPPTGSWRREGDNSGGILGVRFVLTGGGGQCLSVGGYRLLADRDVRGKLERLVAARFALRARVPRKSRAPGPHGRHSPSRSRRDGGRQRRAQPRRQDYVTQQSGFVTADLEAAVRAAASYEPTLDDVLPRVRLHPERMQEPERWRIGIARDTTLAGHPAFASDDTLITPERPLLYHQVFWVVRGCAFQAVYQGTPQNLATFDRVIDSIQFPEAAVAVSN
jgi:hypothetical protein